MPFFDDLSPRKKRRRRRRRRKDEYGRPTLLLPGYLPEACVLAATEDIAVVIHGIACYPSGFALRLEATSRWEDDHDDEDFFEPFDLPRGARSGGLRFGIEYADRRRGTLDEVRWAPRGGGPQSEILIMMDGGSSGGGHSSSDLFVEPLPPPGPVTFAVEWPAAKIEETLQTLDGELFQEAAGRATPLFPG